MKIPEYVKKRLRHKPTLVAIGSFIALGLKVVFNVELPSGINELAELGLSLAVMLGIVTDPTTAGIKDGE